MGMFLAKEALCHTNDISAKIQAAKSGCYDGRVSGDDEFPRERVGEESVALLFLFWNPPIELLVFGRGQLL